MEYALRALARRGHTSLEMRQKLRKRPHHTGELEELVLSRLIERKWIDDEAFVKRRVEDSQNNRHDGLFKLAYKLKQKGIPMEETQKFWKETGISEMETASAALGKFAHKLAKIPKEKQFNKQARFLAAKGFSPDTIYKLLARHREFD